MYLFSDDLDRRRPFLMPINLRKSHALTRCQFALRLRVIAASYCVANFIATTQSCRLLESCTADRIK
jgi:hypothetical protein